jgi:hypothetical protein
MNKLLSFSQVRILPQEEGSCLRIDGVRVEGDRNTGATPAEPLAETDRPAYMG